MIQVNTISPIQLSAEPVQGVVMDHTFVLRLDLLGGNAPGNKVFKLRYNLAEAKAGGFHRIVSFGGGWSNHLHALAAVGQELGLETIGLVRGEEGEAETPMLADARRWGMQITRLPRADYRRRNEPDYLAAVEARYGPCLLIPEGGANSAGVQGCKAIAGMITANWSGAGRVVLPVGTGATLAGLLAGLQAPLEVVGISSLRGARDLEQRVAAYLEPSELEAAVPWQILHDFHCGGFARTNEALRRFMVDFEQVQGIPLEPVYTGKMMFAIHSLLASGEWDSNQPVLAIHTGGLQGRRGYNWLKA